MKTIAVSDEDHARFIKGKLTREASDGKEMRHHEFFKVVMDKYEG